MYLFVGVDKEASALVVAIIDFIPLPSYCYLSL
jgi:hypothetical protein